MRAGARARLLGAVALVAGASCSLAPFNYRPLDAGADRGETSPPDVDVPPGDADVPPSDVDVPPSDVDVPPSDVDVPPGDVDVPPGDADVPPGDADVPPSDVDVPPGDADVLSIDVDVPPGDADVPSSDATDAPPTDRADAPDDAVVCGDVAPDDRPEAGVSAECPPIPSCGSVTEARPTGGMGTDASPFTGWETIPAAACRVEFPPGVYQVRQPVTLRSNLTIRCMSSTSPVIFRRDPAMEGADGGIWSRPIFSEPLGNDLSNVVIEGCTFDHEGRYVDAGDIVVEGNEGRGIGDRINLYVQDNRFINLDVPGVETVWLQSGTGPNNSACLVVRRNEFLSPRFGTRPNPSAYAPFAVYVTAGEHVLVQGNRTQNHYGVLIGPGFYPSVRPVRDIQVVDNTFDQIKGIAVRVTAQSDAFDRVDGGCGAAVPETSLHGPLTGVHVDGNVITVNDNVYGTGESGAIEVSPRVSFLGCRPDLCGRFRPMRDVSVVGNTSRGARFGIVLELEHNGPSDCTTGQEGGALVPYVFQGVRVAHNTVDGSALSGFVSPNGGDPIFLQGVRDLTMTGNQVLDSARGARVSGENLRVTGNTFERLNRSGTVFDDATWDGHLSIIGARFANYYGAQYGASRDVTVACNAFTAPAATGLTRLSAVFVDRGVTGVALTNNAVTGATYHCAVDDFARRTDGGAPDAASAIVEEGTTRTPPTLSPRCP
ncbi:MAG: right-handed parallel beta-helix repeat-containing protein [Polyangiales bacterium]